MNIHLLVIDPQVDFMDKPGSALPVTGATADMQRLAKMIGRIGHKFDDIHVTMDSHRTIDVGHPGMWVNEQGKNPSPFTIISVDDLKAGIWRPRKHQAKPTQLGGQTLGQYMLEYAKQLEAGGQYPLMVWPEHCLIGSPGNAVQADLLSALQQWERKEFGFVDYVVKGDNVYTEHYGALLAEVPMASDPSSGLNTAFLDVLQSADIVVVAGEASSHCVKSTVNQIADNIGAEHVRKFHLLTDCMSPVDAIRDPQGNILVDFPVIARQWQKDMEKRGMKLTTSVDFLA